MSPQLDHIWQQIQSLDEADKLVLWQRLRDLREAQSHHNGDAKGEQHATGWRAVYGAADPTEVAELQRIVDDEFSESAPERRN